MSTPFEIPLRNTPERFRVTLGGVEREIRTRWNVPAGCWVIDINESDGTPFLTGIPLVTGADLLEQFSDLEFGGQLIVQTDHDTDAVPTFDNLGTLGHLYFVVP